MNIIEVRNHHQPSWPKTALRQAHRQPFWPKPPVAACLQLFLICFGLSGQLLWGHPLPIRVPADQPTIQQAIDCAEAGDAIIVSPGTYHERLDFHGRAVTLTSQSGPEATILDGDLSGAVVTFQNGEGSDSVLAGFTVRRGSAYYGAGIWLSGSAPTIVSNIFKDNWQTVGGFGAAIGGNSASPVILQNVFRQNHCDSQNLAGVLSFVNYSSPLIADNLFLENDGRALNLTLPENNNPQVLNNLFIHNPTAIRVAASINISDQTFRNNILVNNDLGLSLEQGPNMPTWTHNLVYQNATNYSGLPDQTGLQSNLSADPLFVCPLDGDFHLRPESPCLDTGNNSAAKLVAVDFEGNSRELDGNGDSIAVVDIGPFEFDPANPREPCLFIQCPASVLAYAAPGAASVAVTYPPSLATPGATLVTVPPSGSVFPAGTNAVTSVATLGTDSVACSFSVIVFAPPANDEIQGATLVPSLPYSTIQDTTSATAATDDVFCAGAGPSVWYRFVAHKSGEVFVDTQSSDYGVSVSAFTGAPGDLARLGCAYSFLKFQAAAGQTYFVMLSPFFRTEGGQLHLSIRFVPRLGMKLQVERVATLDPKSGKAIIRGTVKTTRPTLFFLAGGLSQNRRGQRDRSGQFNSFASCPGTISWQAVIPKPPGGFRFETAKISLTGFGLDSNSGDFINSQIDTVVILSLPAPPSLASRRQFAPVRDSH